MSTNDKTNFIKIDEKVFLLTEKESNISLDVPFQNSISDKIEIEITSESPIFIRNHYVDGDDNYSRDKDGHTIVISKEFCHYNSQRYIPASSIKGMIRNLIEIISYSKLKNKTLDKYLDEKLTEDSFHKSDKMDLSEAIFGTTSLKGRVTFSHFKEVGKAEVMNTQSEILATPQPKENKFGWKNYPILDETKKGKGGNNDKVKSEFNPLKEKAIFTGFVRFHNLRDFELGALLSALTFHNTENIYHNIGLGKSIGYGKINITLKYDDLEKHLKAFEEKLNSEIFNREIQWHKSSYIKELFYKHSNKKASIKSLSDKTSINNLYKERQEELKEEAEIEWNSIKNTENKSELIYYKKQFPDFYTQELDNKIMAIEEQERFRSEAREKYEKICDVKDVEILKEYLTTYRGFFQKEIEDKIKEILKEQQKIQELKKKQEETKKEIKNKRGKISSAVLSKIQKNRFCNNN